MEKVATPVLKQAQVYDQLKNAILYAQFEPGQILSIRSLADSLGTSTMPVREAATRLIAEGALVSLPNKGLRVPTLSAEQALDIFRVRVVLESMAAGMAAERITAREIEELEGFESQLERALEKGQLATAVQANMHFHLGLYRASRSETLVTLIEALYLRYAPTVYTAVRLVPGSKSEKALFIREHHAGLLDALRRKDSRAAKAALKRDLEDFWNLDGFLPSDAKGRGRSESRDTKGRSASG